MLFSEPKIPQLSEYVTFRRVQARVSVLFSEPKIPQHRMRREVVLTYVRVSVLFSEPKIPQYAAPSAANRAVRVFQCSSASRKFLNQVYPGAPAALERRFSALQRAENSSIGTAQTIPGAAREFQCSSASRKFLNPDPRTCVHPYFRPR